MKVTELPLNQHTKGFPKCMRRISDGALVLFGSKQYGTVIKSDKLLDIGEYYTNWNMMDFVDFTGIITITQD